MADALTSVRFVLGLYLVWLGLYSGPEGVATAALTLLTAWVTDVLDGPLARRDARGLHTWIGDHDLEADLTVALGIWVYLSLAGFIPFWRFLTYHGYPFGDATLKCAIADMNRNIATNGAMGRSIKTFVVWKTSSVMGSNPKRVSLMGSV